MVFLKKIISWILIHIVALYASCIGVPFGHTAGESYTSPFSTSSKDADSKEIVRMFNGVCNLFGTDEDTSLVYRFGNESVYFGWMAKKAMWTSDASFKDELKQKITSYPQTDNGYLWSWSTSTYWPTGIGNMHYDGLFQYINAVCEIISWENSVDFLYCIDEDTYGSDSSVDASKGRSVYDKCAAAMDYSLNLLDGSSGVITITEKSVYLADNETRFDINEKGENIWNNTGRYDSSSSNYWDNFCFGNTDAYETVLFYEAVNSMCTIEKALGHDEKASEYEALSQKIHTAFDKAFWDGNKGRYIGCIDADGNRHDYGFTFLNTYAVAVGLGDKEKAESIFSWINGERVIDGDTKTGRDILDYSDFLNDNLGKNILRIERPFVPRSTTVSIESKSQGESFWWESLENNILAKKGENAEYGKHLENGGYIFWTLYYELLAYCRYDCTDCFLKRLSEISDIYSFNGFDSDINMWAEGLIGEFPENGIVNRIMLSNIMGIDVDCGYLVLSPKVSEKFDTLSVDCFVFGGQSFSASIDTNSVTIVSDNKTESLPMLFNSADVSSVNVRFFDGDTLVDEMCVDKDESGKIIINENLQSFTRAVISY